MTGELVSAAQIIAGSGAAGWLAEKLLGPSFDGLGQQLKAYAGDRLNKIFGRASTKINVADAQPLPAGFAINFVQKASFSEDDEALTSMWANLLASAATNFESRQSSYVEILSQLTASDARLLDEIVPKGMETHFSPIRAINEKIETRVRLAKQINNISPNENEGQKEIGRLLNIDLGWPGRVNSARAYFANGHENSVVSGGKPVDETAQDNLARLGLLEKFEISNSLTPMDVGFEGVFLTTLGLAFLQSCRGFE